MGIVRYSARATTEDRTVLFIGRMQNVNFFCIVESLNSSTAMDKQTVQPDFEAPASSNLTTFRVLSSKWFSWIFSLAQLI